MRIDIPFCPEMRRAVLEGRKTCTSRRRMYGSPGDVFPVEGRWFMLRAVEVHTLAYVKDQLFRQEGFVNPEDFERIWNDLHPRKGYIPSEVVHVHHFAEVVD